VELKSAAFSVLSAQPFMPSDLTEKVEWRLYVDGNEMVRARQKLGSRAVLRLKGPLEIGTIVRLQLRGRMRSYDSRPDIDF
jgi:hypothetical protein